IWKAARSPCWQASITRSSISSSAITICNWTNFSPCFFQNKRMTQINPCHPWLKYSTKLARNVNEHLRARFDFQFLTAFDRQRTGATSATTDQPDRRAFAAARDTTNNRADRRANAGALDRLVAAAT